MTAKAKKIVDTKRSFRFKAQRGSLVSLKTALSDTSNLAIVVSNDIQNDVSDFMLVVPLQRRVSRLKAPFAVNLARSEGMRDLHTARCDWLTRVRQSDIKAIERAKFPLEVVEQLEHALRVALGFREVI